MKIALIKLLTISTICTLISTGYAQESVNLRRALKDELKRNMEQLDHPEYDRPFYIAYQVVDGENTSIAASLGGIVSSSTYRGKTVNGRVLVGGYGFNDESFPAQNIEPYYSYDDSRLPLADDYYGIRRVVWDVTDKIYKTAGEIFESHKKILESKGKTIAETPHLRFSRETPIIDTVINDYAFISKGKMEQKLMEVSSLFLDYPAIEVSSVNLNIYQGANYFVSSEGSDFAERTRLISMFITAATRVAGENYVYDQLSYFGENSKDFISSTDFKGEVASLHDELMIKLKAPQLDESYEGPVLFLAEAVPSLFTGVISQFRPNPPPSHDLYSEQMDYSGSNMMESRLGKKDFQEALTVRLTPKQERYGATRLLGSYRLDQEGMTPKDEIVLIRNGVINELMVGRNYMNDDVLPNGTASGLGVVHIEFETTKKNMASLKKMLLKEAKKKGLSYGLMIKKMQGVQRLDVYKVMPDGTEILYKWATMTDFDKKSLREIMATTEEKTVLNRSGQNGITSFIVPGAMLIDDIEIAPLRMPQMNSDAPLLSSPVSLQGAE